MAPSPSEDRLQSLLETVINADIDRINRLASLGLPRRVPCDPHGQGTNPAQHSDIKSRSPSTTTRNKDLGVPGKNILSSKESSEHRKRKAEKEATSCRERIIGRSMEGHIGLGMRNNSTKEVMGSQDKENINPYCGFRSRESEKQELDWSDVKRTLEVSKKQAQADGSDVNKRVLQVSNMLQNVPSGRKVGSLLMKQSSNCKMESQFVLHTHLASRDGSVEKVRASSEVSNPPDCIIRGNGVLGIDGKGSMEDILIQEAKQVIPMAKKTIPKPSLFGARFEGPNPPDCINRRNGVLGIDGKDEMEESPIQVAKPASPMVKQAIPKPFLFGSSFEESLDAKMIVKGNHVAIDRKDKMEESPIPMAKRVIPKPSLCGDSFEESSLDAKMTIEGIQVAASVRKLSSSMNSLAIADFPHGVPTLLALGEKDQKQKENVLQIEENVHGTFISALKQYDLDAQAPDKDHKERGNDLRCEENVHGTFISAPKKYDVDAQAEEVSAACLSHPAKSVPAWSYTVRTGSAPLSSYSTEDSVPPLNPQVLNPSKVENHILGNDIPKPSQSSCAPPVPEKQLQGTKRAEKPSPLKPTMLESEMMNVEAVKPSREENPLSDAGAGKLIQHLHLPEKRPTNGGEATSQPKRHGENEYFVWVNGRRYQKLKKVGRGGSSEVYKVIDREGNIYALKRIKLKGCDYATAYGFYQEIELLTRLQGKSYIIRLIDHEVTDKHLFSNVMEDSHNIRHDVYIYMVLEYGEVDLATMLQEKLKERKQGGKDVDETWLRFYWQQILEAVNTVHEERIIHADLKPANFLLVKGVLKLIDFGIAKSIQGDTTNIERDAQVGTLNYMSPEAFLMNEKDEHGNIIKCGRPSDIWALGCILYQMVYGKTPFAHITTLHAKIQEVANPNHKINFPPLSNPYLLDIMKKCLAYKREDRSRIPELLKHPFLQPQMAGELWVVNLHGKDGDARRASCARQVEREILLKIRAEQEQRRDVRALKSLLEKVRLLELCGRSMETYDKL